MTEQEKHCWYTCSDWKCQNFNMCKKMTLVHTDIINDNVGESKRVKKLQRKRLFVYNRDGNKCLKCGRTDNLTLDHVIPVSKGGNGKRENLQTLCYDCNQEKKDEYIDYRDMTENVTLFQMNEYPGIKFYMNKFGKLNHTEGVGGKKFTVENFIKYNKMQDDVEKAFKEKDKLSVESKPNKLVILNYR